MSTTTPPRPLEPGEPAPDFALPAVNHEGTVSLEDFKGDTPLFLALFRGLYCPFCRRAIAELGQTSEKLAEVGVKTLGVVATPPDNARLYFRFRPSSVMLAADPEADTHRSFGIPKGEATPELMEALGKTAVNPTGELESPKPVLDAVETLNSGVQGYTPNETDQADFERQFPQLKGQFLIDADGIVRWVNVECQDGLEGFGRFPTVDEILEAVKGANLA